MIVQKEKKYQKKDMCFVDFTYNRENDNNYRNNMITALEVFDSLQENIKKIKEGQLNNINNNDYENNHSIRSGHSSGRVNDKNEKSNNKNKGSFIINENVNTNININNNNIYSFENSKSNSKGKKKIIENNNNNNNHIIINEKKNPIRINNNIKQNNKVKPINVFSNKSHYIPVSNNKSGGSGSNSIINSGKTNSKGKIIKKQNETNIMNKKIISHPSSATGGYKPLNNSGVLRKTVKVGNNNNIPSGKIQISKMGKQTTASMLNKQKPTSAKIKK